MGGKDCIIIRSRVLTQLTLAYINYILIYDVRLWRETNETYQTNCDREITGHREDRWVRAVRQLLPIRM